VGPAERLEAHLRSLRDELARIGANAPAERLEELEAEIAVHEADLVGHKLAEAEAALASAVATAKALPGNEAALRQLIERLEASRVELLAAAAPQAAADVDETPAEPGAVETTRAAPTPARKRPPRSRKAA
ncbi:MAG TPA: hypothetical protein VMA83_01710, partial [Solirubrobacteraceae bacterium]|nr:hypothetical protein [Solirubrobacteraceae bacterium]